MVDKTIKYLVLGSLPPSPNFWKLISFVYFNNENHFNGINEVNSFMSENSFKFLDVHFYNNPSEQKNIRNTIAIDSVLKDNTIEKIYFIGKDSIDYYSSNIQKLLTSRNDNIQQVELIDPDQLDFIDKNQIDHYNRTLQLNARELFDDYRKRYYKHFFLKNH